MMEIVERGIVYRNPRPEMWAIHACLPDTLPLGDNEILCVYRRGQAFISPDGRVAQARSMDGGRTWTDEGIVWDGKADDKPYDYRMPQLTLLADGTLLLAVARLDRTDPDKPMYNPVTEGLLPFQILVFRSKDGGRNWGQPSIVKQPPNIIGPHDSHIMAPASGLVLPFCSWKGYDDPTPVKPKVMAYYSKDGGLTWGDPRVIADGEADGVGYWDGRTALLGGDRILEMYWTHDLTTDKDRTAHRTVSEDGGRTWSHPEPTNLWSQIVAPLHLGGSRVLAIYNDRDSDRPGINVAISEDEGKTFDLENQVKVWDPLGELVVGLVTGDREMDRHLKIAWGMPCARRLANGEVLATFWCTHGMVAQIRWARLKID